MFARIIALPQLNMFRSRTAGSVSKLFVANVAGIVISTLTAPIVARLYSPTVVGEFALFTAFSSMLTPLFTLRYETAVMLPKSDQESAEIFSLVERIILGWLVLLSLVVFFTPENLFKHAGYESLYSWRVLAVIVGFLNAAIIMATAWQNRAQGFGIMSSAKILQNITYAISVVGLGWMGWRQGQIWATLFSCFLSLLWLNRALNKPKVKLGWQALVALAKKYANAPVYLFPSALLDTFTKQMPVFLITTWFSTELAGNFSIAWRLVFLPIGLLGAAVGPVFYQRFAQVWPDRQEARRILFKTWLMLTPVAIIPCVLIMLFGPQVFTLVLGEKWHQAGNIAAVIAPMTFFVFLSSPTSSAFIVLGLQKYSLVFGLATLVYRPLCLWLGWHYHSLMVGLVLLTAAEIIQIIIYNGIVLIKTKEKEP